MYNWIGQKLGLDIRSADATRANFIFSASLVGLLVSATFSVVNLLQAELLNAVIEGAFSVLLLVNIFFLFLHKRIKLAASIILTGLCVLFGGLLITGGIAGTGIFWVVNFPISAFLLLGRRGGLIATLALILEFGLIALLSAVGALDVYYDFIYIRQMVFNLMAVASILYIYESILQRITLVLERQEKDLDSVNKQLVKQLEIQNSGDSKLRELVKKSKDDQEKLAQTQRAITNVLEDLQREKDELQQLTERNNAIISSMGDGMIVTDEYGKIRRVNRQFLGLMDKSEREIIDKHISTAIDFYTEKGDKVTAEENVISESLLMGQAIQTRYITKNEIGGVARTVALTASPFIVNDKPAGVVLIARDVSEQAAIERSKTEFVSLASHQLRTPLSTIEWYIEMLLSGEAGELNKETQDFLGEIYRASKRMVNLVNALLNVSRVDLGTLRIDPEEFNIAEVVGEVKADYMAQIEKKKMKIVEQYEDKLPKIIIDKKILTVVVQNLLSNAIKYTPAKGTITVKVRKIAGKFIIAVQDSGLGIPTNQQDKIFTKLFRADNAVAADADGNGLGLYLVKSIVEQVGGNIGFTSSEGKGSTFNVSLPERVEPKAGEGKSLSKTE